LAADLSAKHGTKSWIMPIDLNAQNAVADIVRQAQGLDVGLVVAAAGFGSSGALLKGNIANEIEMVKVNCEVPMALSYFFADKFVKQKLTPRLSRCAKLGKLCCNQRLYPMLG